MRVDEFVKMWYEVYKAPILKQTSLDSIKYTLKHILPMLGQMELTEVRGIHIQSVLNSVRALPNTMTKCKVICGDIFSSAYNNRYIDFNPFLAVKQKPAKKKHRKSMSVEEQRIFEASLVGKPYELLYLTYLYTGARRNELLYNLYIDFENALIYINGTKTANSVRVVPLFDILADKLKKVNYKRYFKQFKPDYVTHRLLKHCRASNIQPFCVHALRTTFATRCFEAGIAAKTLQAWLGHSDINTTMDIYVDKDIFLDRENLFVKSEIEKFNKYLEK